MAGEDIIMLRLKELKRLKIIQDVIAKRISQSAAAEMMKVSERQIRRLKDAVCKKGEHGIVHKSRGKPSNRKISDEVKENILRLYKEKYSDFGPTLACEKLNEIEGIKISEETLRIWLIKEGIWKKKRKRKEHRQRRERKDCFGEMVQMDGSHHYWFEDRGPESVLMAYIDDATSKVFGRFYDYEGTMPAMDSFKLYVDENGLPISLYSDKHSTYKSQKELTIEEELAGVEKSLSQFERALDELGVEIIHAHSPQAKGRIERLFHTFQDRVIKEMRLKGIKTKEEANEFLIEYLPEYNKRFSIQPTSKIDVHIKPPKDLDLSNYLCIKTWRTVRKDNTISNDTKLYQIEERVTTKKVLVEECPDGTIRITSKGVSLKYKTIEERPKKEEKEKTQKLSKRYIPPKDHPWRRYKNQANNEIQTNC